MDAAPSVDPPLTSNILAQVGGYAFTGEVKGVKVRSVRFSTDPIVVNLYPLDDLKSRVILGGGIFSVSESGGLALQTCFGHKVSFTEMPSEAELMEWMLLRDPAASLLMPAQSVVEHARAVEAAVAGTLR